MSQLSLTFLGGFQATLADEVLHTFESDKVRALLAYLAVEAAQTHSRSALAALLWPGYGEESARASLRQTLYHLRKLLGDDRNQDKRAPEFLVVSRQTIAFNPNAACTVDVTTFSHLLAVCAKHPHKSLADCAVCVPRLRQAVDLYRGDFLAGFGVDDSAAFEEWRRMMQERLHLQVLDALTLLAAAAEAAGDHEQMRQDLLRQLTLEPWREEAHYQLMRVLATLGQRAAAIAQYYACRQILREELGVEPDAQTTLLYEQIRAGTRSLGFSPSAPPASTAPSVPLARRPSYLPRALTPLIGRADAVAQLVARLSDPNCRLITLVGPPGVGKTRLALAAAQLLLDGDGQAVAPPFPPAHFPDGLFFVELTSVHDPAHVASTIAGVLGMPEHNNQPPLTVLLQQLRDWAALLVLDNFEQVAAASTIVQRLLTHCPRLQILVTSRAALHVEGEQRVVVEPFTLPKLTPFTDVEALARNAAVQLFYQRALAVAPHFELNARTTREVAAICARLDGLPLAIELAAARSQLLSPAVMLARLEKRLNSLTSHTSPGASHQQTLHAAIAWSYDLLTASEQRLLRRLAVFVGGFSLDAAEAVSGGWHQPLARSSSADILDGIEFLADKSLLRSQAILVASLGSEPRFVMLETIREYAWTRLTAPDAENLDEAEATQRRHADYFLALAERAALYLHGVAQIEWLDRLELEHDNIRAALQWFVHSDEIDNALRLATALRYFWRVRGHHREGSELLVHILALPVATANVVRAQALNAAGYLQWVQGNTTDAQTMLHEALTIGRTVDAPAVMAFALRYLGLAADAQHDTASADTLLQESLSLYRRLGNQNDTALGLMYLGDMTVGQGDPGRAARLYTESAALFRQLDNKIVLPYALRQLGYLALAQGDLAAAAKLCTESLTLNLAVGEKQGSAAALVALAALAAARQQWLRAAQLLGIAEAWLAAIQTQLLPLDRTRYEQTVTAIRTRLDAATIANAQATGQIMTVDEALAYALQALPGNEKPQQPGLPALGDMLNGNASAPGPPPPAPPTAVDQTLAFASPHDWSEMPDVEYLVGRSAEIIQLQAWLGIKQAVGDTRRGAAHCRLVAVLGMGGAGKTTLAAAVVKEAAPTFANVIWRSLLNAPPPAEIIQNWLQILARQTLSTLPDSADEQLRLLLTYLRQQRCLLVLDNLESILHPGAAGVMRPGYEGYAQLLQHLAGGEHQSVLLLTSREQPHAIARFAGQASAVRILHLAGLDAGAGHAILQTYGLAVSSEEASTLVQHYSGNPLALQLVAQTVQDLFAGETSAFLDAGAPIFDDIRTVLDQQYARLAPLEREILRWLAVAREPVTVQTLRADLVQSPPGHVLLEALRSLQRHSLLEKADNGFTLQNVVMEYITDRLVAAVCAELDQGAGEWGSGLNPSLFNRHTLVKAQAKDYVRQSQERLILQPIAERLLANKGQKGVEESAKHLLTVLRADPPLAPTYAAGNLLNLLLHLGIDLAGYDFSRLDIWHAYLARTQLAGVNFTGANFANTVFMNDFGHIMAVAISPDGRLFAAAGNDTIIRLWPLAEGQPVGELIGHTNAVRALAFCRSSAPGLPAIQLLASGSIDHSVRLWDVSTGVCLHVLQRQAGLIYSLAFSPDGSILASGSADQTICLWDVRNGRLLHTWQAHDEHVDALAFHPDGVTLASASGDQSVRLWDVRAEGESPVYREHLLATLLGHSSTVVTLAFSPDGMLLASASADQTVRLWDIRAARTPDVEATHPLHILRGHTHWLRAVAFSPDGKILATAGADRVVRLWEVGRGQPIALLQGHLHVIWSLAFTPDGSTLISGGEDDAIFVWDVRRPERRQVIRTLQGHTAPIPHLAFSPDGFTLASGEGHHRLRLWDWRSGQCLHTLEGHTSDVHQCTFDRTGQILVSTSSDRTLRFWDVARGQVRHSLRTFPQDPRCLAFAPAGDLLASAGFGHVIQLWQIDATTGIAVQSELGSGHPHTTLQGHSDEITDLAFRPGPHPQPLLLASCSDDQTVRLWDVANRQCLQVLRSQSSFSAVAFSPDGEILAGSGSDTIIWLWQLVNAAPEQPGNLLLQRLNQLRGHNSHIRRLAFCPTINGASIMLASCSEDHTVRLWDVKSGQCLRVLVGHSQSVLSVAFSPDGKILASSGLDQTIRLWDVESGACVRILRPPGPYANMNITGVTGISEVQRAALKALGAVEE